VSDTVLSNPDLHAVLTLATQTVKSVAPQLKGNFGKADYTTKAHENDWVTKWDKWAEEQIVGALEKFDSTIGIVAEEGSNKENQALYWTVDPIDGTAHFVKGIPKCTTMIALVENGVPIAGVIYDFVSGNLFSAAAGLGAYKNKTEQLIVNTQPLTGSTLEMNTHLPMAADKALQEILKPKAVTETRNFASGYAGILTATGQIDAMVYLGVSPPCPWDIAPPAILIQEAGGAISNLETQNYLLGKNCFVAGSSQVVAELETLTDQLFGNKI
jgi:myo-inositol-1(or 4)-monophosphatase